MKGPLSLEKRDRGWALALRPSLARFEQRRGGVGVTGPSVARKSRRRACIGRMREGGGK